MSLPRKGTSHGDRRYTLYRRDLGEGDGKKS